ncbi:MAG: alpha-glucan family phosphorylase [Chloroflexota bacterium]|nr:alpha-glucan family phosphorylase [Chloroflexota bacterium]
MRPVYTFSILPSLPARLERLRELAYNLWWSWNMEAIELFRRLGRDLWETTGHNPVLILGSIEQERLDKAARDEAFLAHMDRVLEKFDRYMQRQTTWYQKKYGPSPESVIAYFTAEFGLTDCIPNYSGGLGVLAGDHLKSASDLGLPLVGVGLLYQQGYFHQYLSVDGWQQERYPENDFYTMPIQLEQHADGTPVVVEVDYPGHQVKAQVWRVQVGRIPLFLLDTNLEENSPEDRDITDQLYGGDTETRIRQEIVLGTGGIRALKALGINPTVCHMNEGHSAFMALERIRLLMEEHNLSFAEAKEAACAGNIFTTHTPVPAGIDMFPSHLMDKYFAHYYPDLDFSKEEFLAQGRVNPADVNEPFSMAVLALRLSSRANGVSELHGSVSRRMWKSIWPGVPEDEIPITSVTNGVHLLSWISHDVTDLFDRYLGPAWRDGQTNPEIWERVDEIPDEELWRTHERRRERLVTFARRSLRTQLAKRGAPPSEIEAAKGVLDPEALTIGFGRRFAPYKRATLILRDPERLARILNDTDRPIQLIYAGKAHPRNQPAKELIKQIVHLARSEDFRRRIVFLEDYDMCVARYMVQGVDLWLNNPRRFQEASGTSGMKATANGAINMSILDGWWDAAYQPEIGWAIGRGEIYQDHNYQDEVESNAIYDLLEKEVSPLFYDRGHNGLPQKWVAKMKAALKAICPYFNTDRMVREYTERLYMPGAQRYALLSADDMARAKALAEWKANLYQRWPEIRVVSIGTDTPVEIKVGSQLQVQATIHLGDLKPEDVTVELFHGPLDVKGEIAPGGATVMSYAEEKGDSNYTFVGVITCRLSGRYGYTLRLLPHHEHLSDPYEPGLILWAES